ncbi:MAG: ATP-grasp domain-containing protein [Clostridiales bacterium]|nr:ATP-grasp domain-containing protein [Clostridiales bacterium]
MNFKGLRVLVLDCYGRQIAVVLRELHKLGCEITTLNQSKLDIGYTSRYPHHKLFEPQTKGNMAELKKVLDREIPSGKYDVVFPMLEPATELLLENNEEYSKYIKIACADKEAFYKAYDKQLTMTICMENGINCPITKTDNETMDEFLSKVKFPLALKPRKGSGSRGFYRAENKEALMNLINSGKVVVEEYVIQEFIDEAEVHRVSYTFIDNDGNVKSSMISKSTRPYPLVVGTNSRFESVDMPEIAAQAEKLLKLMGWRGYASVCFIESEKDGIPKVMEINGRISASLKVGIEAGLPLVQQILENAIGVEVTSAPKDLQYGVRVIHTQSSILWFLKSKDRFRKEPTSNGNRKRRDVVFTLADPLPYFSYTIQCLQKYKSEMKKRER